MMQKANELAIWEGQPLTPMEFHSKLVDDFYAESQKYMDLVKDEANKLSHPNRDNFSPNTEGDDAYDRAMYMFNQRKSSKIKEEKENVELIKRMIAYYTPFTMVAYEGNLGYFLGYKIDSTSKRFKYSKGSIEFVFAFLSKYPLLYTKLTTNLEDLLVMKTKDNKLKLLKYTITGPVNDEEALIIDAWKPQIYKRIIRRFLSGNILSGIVEATKRKKEGQFKTWALTRFTNIDGSYNTAIELKYEFQLPDYTQIYTSQEVLSVASDNANMYDYVSNKIQLSTGTQFVVIDDYKSKRVSFQDIYPIWNIETEKICDRAIAILKRNIQTLNNNKYVDTDIIQFEVIQSYLLKEDKNTNKKTEVQRLPKDKLYNKLFHDQDFEAMFSNNLITKNPEKKIIKYSFALVKDSKGEWTTKYNDFKVYIKRYEFKQSDVVNITNFLNELYKKYEVSFNFRSDIAGYFNVKSQSDSFDEEKKDQNVQVFPKGEYEYRFLKQVSKDIYDAIPFKIKDSDSGAYGGVILEEPLIPTMLKPYEMKPYKFQNEIYVKLTLAVLNDLDKSTFVKELEDLASKDDDYEVGKYVRDFISARTVGPIYFFGDLRISDYGQIFKEFALKKDLSKLLLKYEEEVVAAKQVKSQVNYDDAENFIIKLLGLI
jgi:hypothetical protein